MVTLLWVVTYCFYGSAATITGAGASNYVITNGTGTLSKTFTATGSFTYPVGDNAAGTDYTPLVLVNNSGTPSGQINVLTVNAKEPHNASSTYYLNRYWTVTETGLAGINLNETGTYLAGDVVGGSVGSVASALYPNALPWVKYAALAGTATNVGTTNITSTGNLSGITKANPTVSISPTTVCSSAPSISGVTTGDDPTVTYSWTGTVTGSTPSINATVTGPYTVTVTDGNGFTATSNSTITVNTPAIALTSAGGTNTQTVCNTSPITTITYTVDPGFTNVTLTGSLPTGVTGVFGGSTYTISGTPTVAGVYNYTVTTVSACTPSAALSGTLTIEGLPTITAQPSSSTQTGCPSFAATALSVTATGTGITYQWYSNTTNSTVGGTLLAGATASSYTPVTTTPGVLYYYCIVSGTCTPAVTSTVSGAVTVNTPAAITVQPSTTNQTD